MKPGQSAGRIAMSSRKKLVRTRRDFQRHGPHHVQPALRNGARADDNETEDAHYAMMIGYY